MIHILGNKCLIQYTTGILTVVDSSIIRRQKMKSEEMYHVMTSLLQNAKDVLNGVERR
jgi:hypothetical protein